MTEKYLGINIDYERDNLLPEKGIVMLTSKGFYKKDNEESPQQSFARAATSYCFGDYELAQRLYDAVSKGWFMFASPVLSNAEEINWPIFTNEQFQEASDWLAANITPDGLPISCYLSKIPDTKKGLVAASSEARWLSMAGGGIGIYASNRSPDEHSTGVMAHLRGYDADTLSYKQTSSRRGSMAAYMDIDHPEIKTFLQMRNPVGGDSNKKCFNLNNGLNITDYFMEAVINGDDYDLVDPKHGVTGRKLNAREVWEEILELRFETGEPYLHFVDTVNRKLPKQITNPLYKVIQSNLCVHGFTTILTKEGNKTISVLENEIVDIWNGYEWSSVEIKKTGIGQKLITVHTTSNELKNHLTCTEYHKFYVITDGKLVETRASSLKIGDKLPKVYSANEVDFNEYEIVTSIIDNNEIGDTYCCVEPKRHMAVFNGILTGQCSEIELMTSDKRTAVCCLSSLNLDKFDEWKDTTLVADLIRMLDNVLEYFIRLADETKIPRAIFSAKQERALGLGTFGWHSYLQSKNIPFASGGINSAAQHTYLIYNQIKEQSDAASQQLAKERGECPDTLGSGFRNSHLTAIAPNASSADILGSSPSIECWSGNAFNSQGRAGSFLIKNKYLEKYLESIGKNTKEVWNDIIVNDGSVQHLDFIDDHTKKVFAIGSEISPMWVIELASIRQDFISQGQSINIYVPNDITKQEMSDIHITAWKKGCKALYYCRTKSATKTHIGTGGEQPLNSIPVRATIEYYSECLSCSG